MPEYDGSIRINTNISTKDAKVQLSALQHTIVKTADEIASLRSKMDAMKDVKFPTKEFTDLEAELKKAVSEYDKLQAKMEEPGKPTEKYKALQKDLQKAQSELKKLAGQQAEMEELGLPLSPASINQLADASDRVDAIKEKMNALEEAGKAFVPKVDAKELDEAKKKVDDLKQKLKDLKESGKDTVLGIDTDEYANLARQLGNEKKALAKMTAQYAALGGLTMIKDVQNAFGKLGEVAKRAFSKIMKSAKHSSGAVSSFGSRLKGLAMSALIFNQISKAFNTMISGMKKGFENLAGYSDSYAQSVQNMKNAMSTLGNQFAAAFAPIVQMVIPWLNSLIDTITTAMTYVAQFIAVLGGKSTFTKAKKVQDDYNKSLGGTAKAADKARGALAKFDDLDVLEKNQEDTGGGDGIGSESIGSDMFEEAPIENSISDLVQTIKDFIYGEDWEGLGTYVAEKLNQGLKKIYEIISWDSVGPQITYFVEAFTGSLNGIVDNLDWDLIGQTIGAGINTVLHTINLLFDGFDWINLGKKFGEGANGFVDGIDWTALGSLMVQKFNATIETLYGFVKEFEWSKFGSSLSEMLSGSVNSIDPKLWAETLSELVKGILDTIISFLEETDWQEIGNKVADFIRTIDWTGIMEKLSEGIGAALGGIAAFIWGIVEEAWENVIDWWHEVAFEDGKFTITGLLDGIIEALKNIGKWIYDHIFLPFINGFKKAFGINSPSKEMEEMGNFLMEGLFKGIIDLIDTVVGAIKEVWDGIKEVFDGIITFITGVFTGDWEKAWDGVVGIFDGIAGVIGGIIDGIIGVISTVIDAINGAIQKIKEFLSEKSKASAAGPVGGAFSSMSGTSSNDAYSARAISGYSVKDLPHLATGSVIRGGNPFMAILGDQPAGQVNIEAPANLIKDLVRQGISEAGYAKESVPVNINLVYDGATFARLSVPDILAELGRSGYNVDVLGVR